MAQPRAGTVTVATSVRNLRFLAWRRYSPGAALGNVYSPLRPDFAVYDFPPSVVGSSSTRAPANGSKDPSRTEPVTDSRPLRIALRKASSLCSLPRRRNDRAHPPTP